MAELIQDIFREEERKVRFLIGAAVFASITLHLLLALALKSIPLRSPPPPPPPKTVRLEFIDSPDRILTPPDEPRRTNLISDRASLAQDVIPDKTDQSEVPRAVGEVPGKSVRKVPGSKPAKITEPRWQSEIPETRRASAEETRIRKIAREPEPARPERRAGDTSPFQLKGIDAYLSPEADIPEGKTYILKQVAYNTLSPEVAKYLARLKPRVANFWHFSIMTNTFYVRSKRTSILFKILPDGRIGKVALNEHDGPYHELFYALNAIDQAQPYEPLSNEILDYIQDDGLWLEFNFLY